MEILVRPYESAPLPTPCAPPVNNIAQEKANKPREQGTNSSQPAEGPPIREGVNMRGVGKEEGTSPPE